MSKDRLDARIAQMEQEGTVFRPGVDVGRDLDAERLRSDHDAVVVATGATRPRELSCGGRRLSGVHHAM
ncbi:glutamate synthase, partial [Streptomyces sp. SID6041]|nr:glutamate synthase [Streptomyces sp. SID6041]